LLKAVLGILVIIAAIGMPVTQYIKENIQYSHTYNVILISISFSMKIILIIFCGCFMYRLALEFILKPFEDKFDK